jgi:hypothetical protein
MHIPIPIPIGTKHIATVHGTVWKLVACGQCQQQYAYRLELEASGEDHDLLFLDGAGSAERAHEQAVQNLDQKSRNCVLPVPCPHCGFYQDNMSRQLKDDAWMNPYQIAGAILALLSFVALAFDIAYNWALTVAGAAAGAALLVYGYAISFRFDPNAGDPEPRKALGRKRAVWGEKLAELLAANPDAKG